MPNREVERPIGQRRIQEIKPGVSPARKNTARTVYGEHGQNEMLNEGCESRRGYYGARSSEKERRFRTHMYLGIVGYAGPTAHELRHPVDTHTHTHARARTILACVRPTKHPGRSNRTACVVLAAILSPRRDRIYKYDYKGSLVSVQNVLTFPGSHFTLSARADRDATASKRSRPAQRQATSITQ